MLLFRAEITVFGGKKIPHWSTLGLLVMKLLYERQTLTTKGTDS